VWRRCRSRDVWRRRGVRCSSSTTSLSRLPWPSRTVFLASRTSDTVRRRRRCLHIYQLTRQYAVTISAVARCSPFETWCMDIPLRENYPSDTYPHTENWQLFACKSTVDGQVGIWRTPTNKGPSRASRALVMEKLSTSAGYLSGRTNVRASWNFPRHASLVSAPGLPAIRSQLPATCSGYCVGVYLYWTRQRIRSRQRGSPLHSSINDVIRWRGSSFMATYDDDWVRDDKYSKLSRCCTWWESSVVTAFRLSRSTLCFAPPSSPRSRTVFLSGS